MPIDVDLIEGRAGADPAQEIALAQALLGSVASGDRPPLLRCYRPLPTVAFGRRDTFLPGYARAVAAAGRHGFAPVVRAAGGRAAAYHGGCVVFDEIMPSSDSMSGIHARFAEDAARLAESLRGLGLDARVGELPGEYCPGEFSVNARGRWKLVGGAQRIIRGGWLLSTVVVVQASAPLRTVLGDVYTELGLAWDPATAGAAEDDVPGIAVEAVRQALLDVYRRRYRLRPAFLHDHDLERARALLGRRQIAPGEIVDSGPGAVID